MRIGLLTDGGYPYATGESRLWCDRLVRGLAQHEFDIFALSRSAGQEERGWIQLPPQVRRVRTAPLWAPADDGRTYGRRDRRRFAGHFRQLAASICSVGGHGAADREPLGESRVSGEAGAVDPAGARVFAEGLYGLADLAREHGGLYAALRSEVAVRILEKACRAPGARHSVHHSTVPDLLAFADQLERALRPLSLDWYDDNGLSAVDLCHAASGGSAALPGLLAKRFFGVPLLVTEYGVRLRAHYLADGNHTTGAGRPTDAEGVHGEPPFGAPVRALLAAFQGRLAAEVYQQAGLITPGNAHARRWQERCGADRDKLRTVYPGMEVDRFSAVGEGPDTGDPHTLVWVGRIEPAKDLVSLLHAFVEIRRSHPRARLRIIAAPAQGPGAAAYLAACQALAARLFPDEAAVTRTEDAEAGTEDADIRTGGGSPVSFEEIGGPERPSAGPVPGSAGAADRGTTSAAAPELPDAYAAGAVVVLSSVVEGFPISLVEAMFCGRATVSTDVGAVLEVVGDTGLVVPPRNPRALADACVALLSDRDRRVRLGAAARARALELFTVEQNLAAFHALYLELVSRHPVRRAAGATGSEAPSPLFAHPVETLVPGRWTAGRRALSAGRKQICAGPSGTSEPSGASSASRSGAPGAPGLPGRTGAAGAGRYGRRGAPGTEPAQPIGAGTGTEPAQPIGAGTGTGESDV